MSSDGPAHRVQSAVVEYGYPQGHLGHLSSDEEAAFKNFKIVCEEKGYYKPGTGDEPGTHDDATLLFEFPFALKYLSDRYTDAFSGPAGSLYQMPSTSSQTQRIGVRQTN